MKKFGFNLNYKNSPDEILSLGETYLATGQYEALELTYYENMKDVDTFSYNQAIRQLVKDYRPEIVVHISNFNPSEENTVLRSAILHEFENCCEYTSRLGGKAIVMHSGRPGIAIHVPVGDVYDKVEQQKARYERSWQLNAEMFSLACAIAKSYGLDVYTENMSDHYLTPNCASIRKMIDELKLDNLHIVLDIGHAAGIGLDPYEEVLAAGPELRHLHLHDYSPKTGPHVPIGNGQIDYKKFFLGLEEVGYSGLYMLELLKCDSNNLQQCRENLIAASSEA